MVVASSAMSASLQALSPCFLALWSRSFMNTMRKKARQVDVEEAAQEIERGCERGTVRRWDVEKGFGFVGRGLGGDDAKYERRIVGGDLNVGQAV